MISYASILASIAPVFAALLAGFGARRLRLLLPEGDASLVKIVVNILYPCLILRQVLGNEALRVPANILIPPLAGFGTVVLGFAVAYLLAPLLGLKVGSGRRTFGYAVGIFNYGYMAIPIVDALFAKGTLGVLFVFNLGVELALWTVGIVLMSGSVGRESLRRIANGPSIALLLGLALNATGTVGDWPPFILSSIGMLGAAAVPLGVMVSGATLADETRDRSLLRNGHVLFGACALRLGLLPILFIGIALYLPGLSRELQEVLIVQAAMPAALFSIVLSRYYGGHPGTAVQVVASTTLLSMLTIPLWIGFGLRVLGQP